MDRPKLKHHIILVTYAIVLFLALWNLPSVIGAMKIFYIVFLPAIYGFVIAFLLNIPYKWIRSHIFRRVERSEERRVG